MTRITKTIFLGLLFLGLLINSNAAEDVETTRFLHPAGLEFYYPSGWSVNDSTFADIELVPADQNMSPQGPTEAYFLWGLGLDPSKSAEKQVVDQLENLMEQIASFLRPDGEPEAFLGKKVQGLVYTWRGKRPDGNEVLGRIFVLPQKYLAFVLVALGLRENIVKRESFVSEIFGSFVFKEVLPDTKLTGRWLSVPEKEENKSEGVEALNEMELNADGSFRIATPTSNSAEHDQELAGSGRWYTLGDKVYFVSPGNVALTFRYELTGEPGTRILDLDHSNGDRQEFQEEHSKP